MSFDFEKVGQKVGKFFSLRESFVEWKSAIDDLNTTNWLTFTGVGMGVITGFFYFVTWIIKIILAFKYASDPEWGEPEIIHLEVFIAWLGFVSGWMLISVRQFKHKRETHFEAGHDSIRHAQARNGETK